MAIYPQDTGLTRKPDINTKTSEKYLTNTITLGQGYEKTIINSRKPMREYMLVYKNIHESDMQRIKDFYRARSGTFQTFIFNLEHINESGSIRVKFKNDLKIEIVGVGDYYSVTIEIREVLR